MMENEIRVRFAPSPTGYLHIGGARTAVYNWLFAKKHNGKFILRIEDTDTERSTEASTEGILDGLRWLGILWDEGPNLQSNNIEKHKKIALKLLSTGHAYKCFCTKEGLDARRELAKEEKRAYKYEKTCTNLTEDEIKKKESKGMPFVVRFKVPEGEGSVIFKDVVYGINEKKYEDIEDFVILRSDGSPLYLLSNAVDDINDRITHVIRGQDGLANTPRQILIYEALGITPPVFAHMPLTLDTKKEKISKRKHGEVVAVQFYREKGFIPWALVNFLVLLGWHTSDDREIFTREELIDAFTLEGVSKSNSIFNYKPGDPKFFTDPKALSINATYLRSMPVEELNVYLKPLFMNAGLWLDEYESVKKNWFNKTIDLIRSRYHTLNDFVNLGRAYFSDEFPVDEAASKKNILKHPHLKDIFPLLAERLGECPAWEISDIEATIRQFIEEKAENPGTVINGIRTVVSGQSVGPGLFELIEVIGKERVIERLKNTLVLYK
jgi:glutamyl-tRNA synthetase